MLIDIELFDANRGNEQPNHIKIIIRMGVISLGNNAIICSDATSRIRSASLSVKYIKFSLSRGCSAKGRGAHYPDLREG